MQPSAFSREGKVCIAASCFPST